MDLIIFTLTQLFTRQAMLNAQHQSAILSRNQHPTISAEWDLWNAVATGLMEDLADVNAEIARRLADELAELRADRISPRGPARDATSVKLGSIVRGEICGDDNA